MKIKENETYQIMFKERIELDLYFSHDPKTVYERLTFKNLDVEEVAISEIDKKTNTVTISWIDCNRDYVDEFASDVPIDSFEILKVRKIIWEDVK